ncbi:hypothetical protein, partial [Nocardioides fonticola]
MGIPFRLSPPARLVAALTLLAAAVGAGVPLAPLSAPAASAAGAGPRCGTTQTTATGTWRTRPAPAFPTGEATLSAAAVDPANPTTAYVSNGTVILRTLDGCTWQEIHRIDPGPTGTSRIVELSVHPRDPTSVWAVVLTATPDLPVAGAASVIANPYGPSAVTDRRGLVGTVLHSSDAGRTWTSSPDLPAPTGRLALVPSAPAQAYLPTDVGLVRTLDAGATWLPLPPPAAPVAGESDVPVIRELSVDPHDPALLRGQTQYPVRSTDGGLTWQRDGTVTGFWAGPYLDGGQTRTTRLLTTHAAYASDQITAIQVEGFGAAPVQTPVPAGRIKGQTWQAAWSAVRTSAVLATWDAGSPSNHPDVGLYRIDVDPKGRARVRALDKPALPPVLGVQADDAGSFHLRTRTDLVTYTPRGLRPPGATAGGASTGPTLETVGPVRTTGVLRAPTVVTVPAGSSRPVDLRLTAPPRARPLDVYFLLDTSTSFDADIDALADGLGGLVERVAGAGIDAWYGLGELGTSDGGRRYRRWVDLARPGPALGRGFASLRTGGGAEAHLMALDQVATGAGLRGTTGPDIAPGQDPTWRPGALRLVLVVTDTGFADEGDADAPTRTQVFTDLATRHIHTIGLEIARDIGDDGVPGRATEVSAADAAGTTVPTPARDDLSALAAATDTRAPAGGVDCLGNGTVEIPAGAPLVCSVPSGRTSGVSRIADAVARVLLAQQQPGSATLTASGAASWRWTGPRSAALDVRRSVGLATSAIVGCTAAQAGRDLPMRVSATSARARLATARVVVRCRGAAAAPPAQPEERAAPPASAAPVAPAAGG